MQVHVFLSYTSHDTHVDLAGVVDAMQGVRNLVDMILIRWKVLKVPKHTKVFFFAHEQCM